MYKKIFLNTRSPPEHAHTYNIVIDRRSLGNVYHTNMQSSGLQILCKLRLKYPRNLLIGYPNINSLRNKIIDVREIIGWLQLDCFVISETKSDFSFRSVQFHIEGYDVRNRRDRNKSGHGLNEFVKKGVITEGLNDLETNLSETICTEITISKKRLYMSVYRPRSSSNIDTFLTR